MNKVRVRFAPSPTGPLHIGGVRTALYNYLFARKQGGVFILRIEDTDQARFVEGAEDYIIESLRWCGITFDEGVREGGPFGPYRQSERKHLYRSYADQLVASGHAYFAFDTPEELDAVRIASEKEGKTFLYNSGARTSMRNSLSLPEAAWKEELGSGKPYVIRYRMPENEDVHFDDIIRGHIVVNTDTLDDKVLFKSDGMPTYHLANIVDDHLMQISHVIRGEEWLPSLPLHILLYRSFGWDAPAFAHLPLLLKPDGKGKLSKRDGDRMGFPVFPLFWPYGETAKGYREEGYYPEAFINMLALLGWNPGTEQEIFSMEQLTEAFSIERVNKSGSRFDPEKARWFNHQYLQNRSNKELAMDFREYLRAKGHHHDIVDLETLVAMVKERVSFVSELWAETDFFFVRPGNYDGEVVRKRWTADSAKQLGELAALLSEMEDFTPPEIEKRIKDWIAAGNYNTGAVMNALRLVIVGASRGPHIFDILAWIGKGEAITRIENGIAAIGNG